MRIPPLRYGLTRKNDLSDWDQLVLNAYIYRSSKVASILVNQTNHNFILNANKSCIESFCKKLIRTVI